MSIPEAYSETFQTCKLDISAKIVKGWKQLTIWQETATSEEIFHANLEKTMMLL